VLALASRTQPHRMRIHPDTITGRSTELDVLSLDECRDRLARAPIGRVAAHLTEHPPAIFPINYFFDQTLPGVIDDSAAWIIRAGTP
jgi:hypothetical protein